MSQATKRKHVVKEVLGDFVTPTENQQIVKVSHEYTALDLTYLQQTATHTYLLT